MSVPEPTLIVVSGPAGSGKTTLAHAIAKVIGCPAICRDEIKEGMVHAVGSEFVPGLGDLLTQRTLTAFFALLRLLLEAGVTTVAEAAFQDHVWQPNLEPLAGTARLRVVHCRVDPAVARQRVASRPDRSAHADATVLDDARYFEDFKPLSLRAPSVQVDTSGPYRPSLDDIAAFVNAD